LDKLTDGVVVEEVLVGRTKLVDTEVSVVVVVVVVVLVLVLLVAVLVVDQHSSLDLMV
jgi:hypothetical protein